MKDKTDVKINNIMPCVPTRDLVVFPGMSMHFDVGRPRTIKSMKNAMDGDQLVFLCAQKDVYLEMPEKKDMVQELSDLHLIKMAFLRRQRTELQ